MNIDQKYFPEFKQQLIDVGDGIKINTLVGGKGSEAILLLHGHPETHLIWRFLTPGLTGRYTVVITDLPPALFQGTICPEYKRTSANI